MVPLLVFVFLLASSHFPFLYSTETQKYPPSRCLSFNCRKLGDIRFPFTQVTNPDCGLCMVNCSNQKIQLEKGGRWFKVHLISEADTIFIKDKELHNHSDKEKCDFIDKFPRPRPNIVSFQILPNVTLFKCKPTFKINQGTGFSHYAVCNDYILYFIHQNGSFPSLPPDQCSTIHIPGQMVGNHNNPIRLISKFKVRVFVSYDCSNCHFERGGECQINNNGDFLCAKATVPFYAGKGTKKLGLKKILALDLGGPAIMFISVTIIFIWCRYKRKYSSSRFSIANTSSDLYTESEMEGDNLHFGVPIFSYAELKEATNNFDSQKKIGDGGYGAVYYGQLQDGREVAVKRLYEHNYRRIKQFQTEIEILRCLHHKNLVSLYGCTSQHSQEILLIYEFVPNGTVADHLYGDQTKFGSFFWPIRMRIAMETASALAYLHASEIIHRDVKTSNILLDSNFCVKVADFGLSRLFPIDVTHISTAPQGTPGYVDPEYYYCCRLTDKSDVYSFGVVLVELISSMPAIDITRQRHEVNLANLAINKIQKGAFHELIDPSLGYNSDKEVERMTSSVAELAFLCLQQDKEMRPTMGEVVEQLKRIESGEYDVKNYHY